jgi:O-antigen ligase
MVADHPLLGIGLDNFLYEYRNEYMLPEAWEEPNISHPHNFVLHFWLQLGLPGLIAAVALLVWTARAAHRRFWQPAGPIDRALAAGVLGGLIDFVVHGSVDNSYFLVDAAVIWWLAIALLLVAEQMPKRPEAPIDPAKADHQAADVRPSMG